MIEQIPLPGRLGRRRDLELRDQPLDRQGRRADRDRTRAQAGRPDRDQRRRRRGPALARAERAERGSYVGCIAGALSKGEYEAGLEAAGFEQISVEFTHQVADGMHGAIVKAVKAAEPERKGLAGDPAGGKRRLLLIPAALRAAAESGGWYRACGRGAWRSLVSALVWGTRGPEFESRRPD